MTNWTVGVVGLGLLGRGITACLLSRGLHVIGCDRSRDTQQQARGHIAKAIEELVARGGFPQQLRTSWPGAYVEAASLSEFSKCNFVIESILENLDAKEAVFSELERTVGAAVPIASNTSALPITQLQAGRQRPERFIGMHWAEPCHLTRFLEVIRGEQTNDATVDAALQLGRLAGKDPSLVQKDVAGFIVNRLGYAMFREAFWLLENGVADVETIDRSFQNALSVWANIAGPFRWMDLTGIPAYAAVMQQLFPQLSCATEVPRQMQDLVASGAVGIANGRGFYSYTQAEAAAWTARLHENVWRVRQLQLDLFPEDSP